MTRNSKLIACGSLAVLATAALALALAGTGGALTDAKEPEGLILYHAQVDGTTQVFSIRPDGTRRRQLTKAAGFDAQNASFSADGEAIVFERVPVDESRAAVVVMSSDGSVLRELTPSGYQGQPSFARNGRIVVYSRDLGPSDNGIWVMGADGSKPRRLTRNPYMRNGKCGCDEFPTVSPDGKRVAFVRVRVDAKEQALFTVGIDGTGLKQVLPFRPDVAIRFDWSPDGKRIAFTRPADHGPSVSANVYTVRPDGTMLRPVTRYKGGHDSAYVAAFSPDGSWLALQLYGKNVHFVHPDGTGLRTSPLAGTMGITDWGLG